MDLETAAALVEAFGVGPELTARIAGIEGAANGVTKGTAGSLLDDHQVSTDTVLAVRRMKQAAGQVNVVMHAVGILACLPKILRKGEEVEALSLGAGNSGRDFDLETNHRIAEFKFINWRKKSNTIRQNNVFADVLNLAIAETDRRRELYLVDPAPAEHFLSGGRALDSVLGRHPNARRRFQAAYPEPPFETVGEFWASVRDRIHLVDLRGVLPELSDA
jgi:hypothetical protein